MIWKDPGPTTTIRCAPAMDSPTETSISSGACMTFSRVSSRTPLILPRPSMSERAVCVCVCILDENVCTYLSACLMIHRYHGLFWAFSPDIRILHEGGCTLHETYRALGRNAHIKACALPRRTFEVNSICTHDNRTYDNPFVGKWTLSRGVRQYRIHSSQLCFTCSSP